ncbi:hypothetical protein RvY_10948-2 [Ramazzottius varieornatus]|uniref:Uncharacterized protein n=1 Tax=Ramazzottius varieornatus TaxID=947166 RepID=A0A1D1VGX2_RAMVA|nr:hypothetical protein RvY_10948-2 [Ramazzottius varieornatus]
MVVAEARGMTDAAEFAYLYFQPHSTLPDFPDLHWQRNDTHDEKSKFAFSAVLTITFDNARNVESLPSSAKVFILSEYARRWNVTMQYRQKVHQIRRICAVSDANDNQTFCP